MMAIIHIHNQTTKRYFQFGGSKKILSILSVVILLTARLACCAAMYCSAGTFSSVLPSVYSNEGGFTGAYSCDSCPAGWFWSSAGYQTGCRQCPAGTYSWPPLSLHPIYSTAPTNGLKLHYRFDNVSGSRVANMASGSAVFDATLKNGAKVNNNQLQLSNANQQYMMIDPFTTGNEGMTFATWWWSDSNFRQRLFDFGNADDIMIFSTNSQEIMFYAGSGIFNIGNANTGNYPNVVNFVTGNGWNHIAWTLDPSGSWSFYINGNAVHSFSMTYPQSVLRSSNLLGTSISDIANPNGLYYYDGGIKDFRMYSRVLSATEINTLFTATQTTFVGATQCLNCPAGTTSSAGSGSCSGTPTQQPSTFPTAAPSTTPTQQPSTSKPSNIPSTVPPSVTPTEQPSVTPSSIAPTVSPSVTPTTQQPSVIPSSIAPTVSPSVTPTTQQPSVTPSSIAPTESPSSPPTDQPSVTPSSIVPSLKPIIAEPHLVVQVSSAVLTQILSPDWDSDGCLLPTNSLKFYLKVELSVTNTGGSEFSPAPGTVRSVNCKRSDAVVGFFQLSFPGGPYFKDAVCLSDSSHNCARMGLAANGGAYSATVHFYLKNYAAVVETYPDPTYPAVVTAVAEGVQSEPSASVPTSMTLH